MLQNSECFIHDCAASKLAYDSFFLRKVYNLGVFGLI